MKLTRKLIPAFAMLLLSAVLLSTASFAWFTSNASVAASGMKVQATTAANLLISTDGSSSDVAVNFNEQTATTLTPCSTNATITGSNFDEENVFADSKFYALANNQGIDYETGAFNATTEFKNVDEAEYNNYFKHYTFQIKYEAKEGSSATGLHLSALNVTAPNLNISKALRVAIVATNSTSATTYSYLFAPLGGTYLNDGKSVNGLEGTKATLAEQALSEESIAEKEVVFGDLTALETVVTFDVFVWYEGNDTYCTSANATATEALSIDFSFGYVSANG